MQNLEENASENHADLDLNGAHPNWDAFTKINKLSWQMSFSYTLFIQMTVLVYSSIQLDSDEDNLAALTLITSLINTVALIGVAPLFAMSLVAGRQLGALRDLEKNPETTEEELTLKREEIAAVFGNGLRISLVVCPFMVMPLVFSKDILMSVFGQNEQVAQICQNFTRPYAATIPPLLLRVCADQVMFMFERTKPAMLMSLLTFAISLSIGDVLAFGKLGSPKLGNDGILLGCILGVYLEAICYLIYLKKSPRLSKFDFYDLRKDWSPHFNQLKDIRHLARSMVFAMVTESSMMIAINSFSGVVGVSQQATMAAILQFSLLAALLQMSFGQTGSQEMSREIGANHFNQASRMGKMSALALLLYIGTVLLIFSIYPTPLSMIISNHTQEMTHTLKYLAPIMFVGCIFDSQRYLLLQQMRVLGDAKKSSMISGVSVVLGIILSGTLGLHTKMGVYGVGAGFTLSSAIACIIIFSRWLKMIDPTFIENAKKNSERAGNLSSSGQNMFKTSDRRSSGGIDLSTMSPMQPQDNVNSI
ncbi:MAG: hypothetical protein CK424_05195 [Legionella sp.]|nr:MAG: hypothetical protein CK424_05195 [Legionella sp.]